MGTASERLRSRHPFETYLLALAACAGISGLFSRQAQPDPIREAVGPVGTTIWLLFMGVGALVALIGVAWPRRSIGLIWEMAGCLSAGVATLFYTAVAIGSLGLGSLFRVLIVLGFGCACLARAWQLHRDLKEAAGPPSSSSGD